MKCIFQSFMAKLLKIIQMISHTQVVWFMVRLSAAIPFTLFGLLMMRINGLFLSLYIVRTPNAGIILGRGDKYHDAVRKMSDLRR